MGEKVIYVAEDRLKIKSNTEKSIAYKLLAGKLFELSETVCLDVNYQYTNLGKLKGGDVLDVFDADDVLEESELVTKPFEARIKSHGFNGGLLFKF
uniref:Porin opacity type domain-containing protein n=1 Tax=viral metagenome TaxID=1070528 RepID=A0A6C0EI88_9ZZZZ